MALLIVRDLVILAVGILLVVLGVKRRDPAGKRTPGGIIIQVLGILIIVWYAVANIYSCFTVAEQTRQANLQAEQERQFTALWAHNDSAYAALDAKLEEISWTGPSDVRFQAANARLQLQMAYDEYRQAGDPNDPVAQRRFLQEIERIKARLENP